MQRRLYGDQGKGAGEAPNPFLRISGARRTQFERPELFIYADQELNLKFVRLANFS
jgi:hypothetical protein